MEILDDYCFDLTMRPTQRLGREIHESVYRLVCRQDFATPGFALLDLGPQCDSITLRSRMLDLKDGLSEQHQNHMGQDIVAVWLGRFNQQVTTKFHLDGGPDASLLMLGYEPSVVQSRVRLADYSRTASQLNMTPREFLDSHNPMFPAGEELLAADITDITRANSSRYQILVINNSCQALAEGPPGWQGVLHQAIMVTPQPGQPRVVNSMLLTVGAPESDALTDIARQNYLTTDQLNQRM